MNALKLIAALREHGVARVSYKTEWLGDQGHESYMQFLDLDSNELSIERRRALYALYPQERQVMEALTAARMVLEPYGDALKIWDLETDTVFLAANRHDNHGFSEYTPFETPALLLELTQAPLERGSAYFGPFLAHSNPLVRLALAQNLNLSVETLEPLLCNLDWDVTNALMTHPHAPQLAQRWQQLALDLEHAKNPQSLPRDLDALSHSVWWTVRTAVAHNPSTPSSTLLRLSSDVFDAVPLAVSANPHASMLLREPLLERFRALDLEARKALFVYPHVPQELLEGWQSELSLEVAQHPDTPEGLLKLLLGDFELRLDHGTHRFGIKLTQAAYERMRRVGFRAAQPFLGACEQARGESSLERQRELAGSVWARVRAELALNGRTEPDVLGALMHDSHAEVRRAAGCNPNTPLERLLSALKTKDVRPMLTNPALSWEVFSSLECVRERETQGEPHDDPFFQPRDPYFYLRANPNTPGNLLERWFGEGYRELAILANPAVPYRVQQQVLQQFYPSVYHIQGENQSIYARESEQVRWSKMVASSSEKRFQVHNVEVLETLLKNPHARPEILWATWIFLDWPSARYLLENPALPPALEAEILERLEEKGRRVEVLSSLHTHRYLSQVPLFPDPWWRKEYENFMDPWYEPHAGEEPQPPQSNPYSFTLEDWAAHIQKALETGQAKRASWLQEKSGFWQRTDVYIQRGIEIAHEEAQVDEEYSRYAAEQAKLEAEHNFWHPDLPDVEEDYLEALKHERLTLVDSLTTETWKERVYMFNEYLELLEQEYQNRPDPLERT